MAGMYLILILTLSSLRNSFLYDVNEQGKGSGWFADERCNSYYSSKAELRSRADG